MFFLLGPTACGKSGLAMALARETGAEIVSVDAFQVYRGLDVGTAKPTRGEQRDVPHHLIDLVLPEEAFTAADYKRSAEKVIVDLAQRGKRAIWVGGTGLYHRVMTKGLTQAPPTDKDIADEIEKMGTLEMAEEIKRVDPDWAEGADLKNRRRMVRALAVLRQTGRTMTDWQRKETFPGPLSKSKVYVLVPKMENLTRAIAQRVDVMLEGGWADEVRLLMQREGWRGSPGSRAIGYAEVEAWVEGRIRRDEARDKIVTNTRAYARRQLTWFHGLTNFQAIETDPQRQPSPAIFEALRATLSA